MSEMLHFLDRTDRTKFRKRYIYPMIQEDLLELTIPNKPQSSNQRYLVTEMGKKLIGDEES